MPQPQEAVTVSMRAAGNQVGGSSRTYVVCEGDTVVGSYRLAAGSIGHADAPGALRRKRLDPRPGSEPRCCMTH